MLLRIFMFGLLAVSLASCVSDGPPNPLSTKKGRETARDAYIQLGLGYLQEGDIERAKGPLNKALELDSRSSNANAAMALVFQSEMEPELADEHFRRALSSSSKGVGRTRILNNYGSFLYEQGRYKEAMKRFNKASDDSMYAGRPRVFENLGLAALKLNKTDKAQEYFERALRLDPKRPQALLEMAEMARVKNEYTKALAYYQRFVDLSAQTARSLLIGARLADHTGDRDRAKSLGLQLKKLYPETPEYQQYLSDLP